MDEFNYVPPAQPANNLARHLVIQEYIIALHHFRNIAEKAFQVRPFYFDNYVQWQYFQQRSSIETERSLDIRNYSTTIPSLAFLKLELLNQLLDRRRQILYWIFYLMIVLLCVFAYRHRSNDSLTSEEITTSSSSSSTTHGQSVQSFGYPSMRMWRRITLPLIQRFPQLTEFYDESCLMQNPFFQGVDALSCDPCANVLSVVDVTAHTTQQEEEPNIAEYGSGSGSEQESSREMPNEFVPFVFKKKQDPIQLEDFYNIYASNQDTFMRDAYRVQSTRRDVTNLEELFIKFNHTQSTSTEDAIHTTFEAHNMWRCNRMLPARLLRKLFASPTPRLPRSGIALERYIAVDTAQAPAYTLPDTECANVYVQQALGTRYIFLRPTSECRHRCRTLSLRLPQSFVLSYNWLYWKPISAPDPVADTFSMTLIGSYC